jgi:hypothetical protein
MPFLFLKETGSLFIFVSLFFTFSNITFNVYNPVLYFRSVKL